MGLSGGREKEPSEEGRIAVGVSLIGGLAARDETGGIGKDQVINISVFNGGRGVLVQAVEEECEAEEGGQGEQREGPEERGDRGHDGGVEVVIMTLKVLKK